MTTHGQAKATSRSGSLDAVRGMAVIGVVAVHSLTSYEKLASDPPILPALFHLFADGAFGVPLFFALSGWLLFSLYWGRPDFTSVNYWRRRIARIWPLWIIFVLVTFIVRGAPEGGPALPVALGLCLVFLSWLSPALLAIPQGGMSIVQEMFHYTGFWLLRGRRTEVVLASVVVGYLTYFPALFLRSVMADGIAGYLAQAWLDLGIFRTWPYFALGGIGFLLWSRVREGRTGLEMSRWSWTLVALIAILSFFVPYPPGVANAYVVGVILVAALLAVALNRLPAVGSAMRSVGLYSYFIYFFHFWVLYVLDGALASADVLPAAGHGMAVNSVGLVSLAAVVLVVSWAFGWVSWRVFERPILRWAHRQG